MTVFSWLRELLEGPPEPPESPDELVPIYDFEKQSLRHVPRRELPPDYIKVGAPGLDELVWANPTQVGWREREPPSLEEDRREEGKALFDDLRNKALRLTRAELGLPAGRVPTEPFGVLMEMGYENGSATVVALGEGSASIYLSTGGGSIGGGGHDPVRKAALAMVATAARFQTQTVPTKEYPPPEDGQVVFYLLTDEGVFTAGAPEMDLGEERHPLSPLFFAGQEVITRYRLVEQALQSGRGQVRSSE